MKRVAEQQRPVPAPKPAQGDPPVVRNAGWSVADIKSTGGTPASAEDERKSK